MQRGSQHYANIICVVFRSTYTFKFSIPHATVGAISVRTQNDGFLIVAIDPSKKNSTVQTRNSTNTSTGTQISVRNLLMMRNKVNKTYRSIAYTLSGV